MLGTGFAQHSLQSGQTLPRASSADPAVSVGWARSLCPRVAGCGSCSAAWAKQKTFRPPGRYPGLNFFLISSPFTRSTKRSASSFSSRRAVVGWARSLCPRGQPLVIMLRDMALSKTAPARQVCCMWLVGTLRFAHPCLLSPRRSQWQFVRRVQHPVVNRALPPSRFLMRSTAPSSGYRAQD